MSKILVKTEVWYSIRNGGDGSASPAWFLSEEHAEKDQENMDEGWGESCTGSVETFIGSDIYKEATENSKEYEGKHEYLKREDYYEARSVGIGARSNKTCEFCGGDIPKGTSHLMHHFYPEFNAYATHEKCSTKFIESLN